MLIDIFLDSLKDTAVIFPFIFLVYVLIEFLESNASIRQKMKRSFSGRFSPLFGAAFGVVPQCGFSVVATNLYQGGYIMAGTLVAVYLATSDEAIPILISHGFTDPQILLNLLLLLSVKLVYAAIAGFLINLFAKKSVNDINYAISEENDEGCCHHHIEGKREGLKKFLLHPLLHSLKILLYIFIINFAFGFLTDIVIGEQALKSFLTQSVYFQPLFSCLVGLIPNCASSVLITEMYAEGLLGFGGAIAGLAVNSGIGMAVLLKNKSELKRNILIIACVFCLSLLLGYISVLFELIL